MTEEKKMVSIILSQHAMTAILGSALSQFATFEGDAKLMIVAITMLQTIPAEPSTLRNEIWKEFDVCIEKYCTQVLKFDKQA